MVQCYSVQCALTLQWEPVEYFDNKIICDLVEEKHKGIMSILDEECVRPGDATDDTFLEKLVTSIGEHKHFITHQMLDYEGRKTIERNQFRLLHYAGEVTYTTVGFIDKNNDMLYRSLKEAANMSADPIVREMYPESELLSQKRPPTVSVCVWGGGQATCVCGGGLHVCVCGGGGLHVCV